MTDSPTIALWRGVLLNEVPRDELERALIEAHIALLESTKELALQSIERVKELATSARRRNTTWLSRLLRLG